MNSRSDTTPVAGPVLYCAGCNERFRTTSGRSECPRCGVAIVVAEADELAETLLIKSFHAADTKDQPEGRAGSGELDDLVGSDLHVYRLESLLGCGGMGRVYLAYHHDLHRHCAVKILSRRQTADDAEFTERFLQEGRAAAALVHPHIVTTHAIGIDRGYHFLEMEFVPGRSLQQRVDDEGRLTPIRATALAARIAEGLAAAHREGIIHRDLKLDNVLLTHQGVPKIADFGLAKRVARGARELSEEWLCGTPNYMAPELFQGAPAGPASDVYALGVCYFVLLTGRLPFVGGSLNALQSAVINDPLPNLRREFPDVSLEMAECLSLLLAKAPANRPRDGIEAAQLLYAVLGQVRDIESMLAEAFHGDPNVRWTRTGNRYRLEMVLPDARRQTLFVEPSGQSASQRLLMIYSLCCDAKPEYYEEALRLNSEMPHGGLAIRDIDGGPKFIVVDTYPRATVDTEEIRRSVLEIAFRADAVEKLLTGLDHH